MSDLIVIGGGLAGCEAAWHAAEHNIHVVLYEMRPHRTTGAHVTTDLAELVCSNSLGSKQIDHASGLLKEELRYLNSLILECAESCSLPAGGALAVDRIHFSQMVTQRITTHRNIQLVRQEICEIPEGCTIIASGPLTSPCLSESIHRFVGQNYMFFYDAIAPIVTSSSIDMSIAYFGSRYDHGDQAEGDYINCPLDKETYYQFVEALASAQRIPLKEFEKSLDQGVKAGSGEYFEGCLPVEVLACRNQDALQYGPMRPVGLTNPHTGKSPFAVVQLRQENFSGELFNMVGFQTNLAYSEQKRVFQMIPGLKHAEFTRYGHMHRNTYIASPMFLQPTMQFKSRDNLFFAGQISGIEGYMGNAASGLLAGLNASRLLMKQPLLELPATTMIGALCGYITLSELKTFQPMKANFGILPPLDLNIRNKRERYNMYATRALNDLKVYLSSI